MAEQRGIIGMVCSQGNISVGAQRYNVSTGLGYTQMYALTSSVIKVPGLSIAKSTGSVSQESLYWRARAPTGVRGTCNGTIVFSVVVQ